MSRLIYPVDVKELVARLNARDGGALLGRLGVKEEDREDQKLTAIVWGVGHGGFPVMADGKTFHPGVDIGLPDVESGGDSSWYGADVFAIDDGEVIYAESDTRTKDDYDFGRVVVRHQGPEGDLYAVYQHLIGVAVAPGGLVKQGDVLGQVGWHGDFPHLHFGICAKARIGGDQDLIPEAEENALPEGDGVWNVLRVKAEATPPADWPMVPEGPAYIYNPIELIRHARGEEYVHDIGTGHLGRVALSGKPAEEEAKPNADNSHKIASHLQSEALKKCRKLAELAHDFEFPAIGRSANDKEVVKAIQTCLKQLGYDVGRFGPNHDGIDGDYGKTCERAVKSFQQNLKLIGKVLEALGHTAEDVKESGAVDGLTLFAMDAAAAALDKAAGEKKGETAPKKEEPATAPAKQRDPPAKVTAPPSAWVFDAKGKKQSVGFGLRMYQALMRWRWTSANDPKVGTGYSAAAQPTDLLVYQKEFDSHIKGGYLSEWPRMDMFPFLGGDGTRELTDGSSVDTFTVFGVQWVAGGFSNCCNVQLAALFVALGGRDLFVQKDEGEVAYWVGELNAKKYPGKTDQMLELGAKKRRAATAFEGVVVGNDPPGVKRDNRGSCVVSTQLLGIGDAIPVAGGKPYDGKYTNKQDVLRYVRIGDWGNYDHHSWLVGEIRYGIWFEGNKKEKPDAFVDQSSLVGAAFTGLVAQTKPPAEAGELSDDQCDWITKHEDQWNERMESLYALAGSGEIQTGAGKKKVAKVEVYRIGVFSANGMWGFENRAIHGKVYHFKDAFKDELKKAREELAKAKDAKERKEKQQALTDVLKPADRWEDRSDQYKNYWLSRGVTNALYPLKPDDPVAFARFFAHAKGVPASNKLSG